MIIAPAIMLFVLAPAYAGQDAAQDRAGERWKPGPKVAQEIARLEHEGRARHRAFLDGKISLLSVIRENSRLKVTLDALRAWAAQNHSDDPPEFVAVERDSDGYGAVFPRGTKHLPRQLVAGETYPASPDSSRRWQYLGDRKVDGILFGVFSSVAPALKDTAAGPR